MVVLLEEQSMTNKKYTTQPRKAKFHDDTEGPREYWRKFDKIRERKQQAYTPVIKPDKKKVYPTPNVFRSRYRKFSDV